jgi:hypothetical protein
MLSGESGELLHTAFISSVGIAPFASSTPTGLTPQQIRRAYGFDQIAFSGVNHGDLTTSDRAIAQNDLAFVLTTQRKNLDEALCLVNEAGDMGFRSELLDTRGMVYLAMGCYADASNDFRESVTVVNPSSVKYLHLAYARDLAKDRDGARAALHSAKEAQLDSATLNRTEQGMYEQLIKDVGP